jgi:hypothetical protein
MGDADGEGIVIRWLMDDGGVGRSELELMEPDEVEEVETERERPRPCLPMGIGLEW